MQSRTAIDGDLVTRGDFSREAIGKMIGMMRSRNTSEFYRKKSPANYLGLRLHSTDRSILNLLSSPECQIVGKESIQNEGCVHIDCETVHLHEGYSVHYEVWLIPERGFLPKKILSTSRSKGSDGVWRERKHNQTVETFMQVKDPILGHSRSFPEICMSRGFGSTATMRVTKCEINIDVTPGDIKVVPQAGTEVVTVEPGKMPKREIHGGGKSLETKRQQAISKGELLANRPMADARPSAKPQWTRTIVWSVAGLFLILTLGVVYLRR